MKEKIGTYRWAQKILALVQEQVTYPSRDIATCSNFNGAEQRGDYYIKELDLTARVWFEYQGNEYGTGRWIATDCTIKL
jgi:hypothetical protein